MFSFVVATVALVVGRFLVFPRSGERRYMVLEIAPVAPELESHRRLPIVRKKIIAVQSAMTSRGLLVRA